MALLRGFCSKPHLQYGLVHGPAPCLSLCLRQNRPLLPLACRAALATRSGPKAPFSLEEVIANMSDKYVLDEDAPPQAQEVEVQGCGTHLGVACNWRLLFRADGAFFEEVRSRYLNFKWHYNSMPGGRCLEVDATGTAKQLDLDDHEMVVLGMLLRTGLWMRSDVMERLGVERWTCALPSNQVLAAPVEAVFTAEGEYPCKDGPPQLYIAAMSEVASSSSEGSSSGSSPDSSGTAVDVERVGSNRQASSSGRRQAVLAAAANTASAAELACASSGDAWGSSSGGNTAVAEGGSVSRRSRRGSSSSSSSSGRGVRKRLRKSRIPDSDGESGGETFTVTHKLVGVCLKFKSGRLVMRLRVDTKSWLPTSYTQSLCGGGELWRFQDWQEWQLDTHAAAGEKGYRSVVWPASMTHNVADGGDYEYHAKYVRRPLTPGLALYQGPSLLPPHEIPADTQYPFDQSPEVPAFRTPMGHLLVPVGVNGKPPGWMILDSGASGFVVDTTAARDITAVEGTGTQVAGVMGKTTTNFMRAEVLTVGPLSVWDQNVMCMDVSSIVKDFHRPVTGIVGHEVFRRLVVEIPSRAERDAELRWAAQRAWEVEEGTSYVAVPSSSSSSSRVGRTWRRSRAAETEGEVALVPPAIERAGAAASGRSAASNAAMSSVVPGSGTTAAAAAPEQDAWKGRFDNGTKWFSTPMLLRFHHVSYCPPAVPGLRWLPLHMVSGLPHLPVTFKVPGPRGQVVSALFMVDTGAGGVDLLFHARAARELELPTTGDGIKTRTIRGVGEAANRTTTIELDLPWLQLGSTEPGSWEEAQAGQAGAVRFKAVRALFPREGGLDISLYSAGIICSGLLDRMHMVLDYPRQRFGFVPDHLHSNSEVVGVAAGEEDRQDL